MAGALLGGLLYEQGGPALMVAASTAAVAIALGAVAATRSLFALRTGNQQEVTFDTPAR
jgi:predicted MFS family arabinose efflux permease